jgi:flagellar biosynthesis protein FliP
MERCKNYFVKLNIFQTSSASNQQTDQELYEQRTQVIATRVYLVLLVLILVILLLFTCFNSETVTITVHNPTLDQIQSLPAKRIMNPFKVQ